MHSLSTAPKLLKALLLLTIGTSLLTSIFEGLGFFFSLEQLLSLSLQGIESFYLWQLFSYLLVQPLEQGVSFSFLFKTAVTAYILLFAGNSFIHKKGIKHFFSLYLGGGLIGALMALGLMKLSSSLFFSGNLTALYALLVAWVTITPKMSLLFLSLPIKAKNIVYTFLGITLFIDFASGQWIYALSYAAAAAFGYFYGVLISGTSKKNYTPSKCKIFDFKTGRALLNDDQFLEEMLSKVALQGKKSLTWKERFRLRAIKKRRKKD